MNNYQQSLKPWAVVSDKGKAVARFKSESDADGHCKVLQKQGKPFKVRFWPVLAATAIALHIMMASESADARRRGRGSRYYRPVSTQTYNGVSYGGVKPEGEWLDRTGRRLTAEQITLLGTLDYSNGQTYGALKSQLGIPTRRSQDTDFYQMPNRNWLQINYRADGKASGYRIGDSAP
jgi:hypothetical protein